MGGRLVIGFIVVVVRADDVLSCRSALARVRIVTQPLGCLSFTWAGTGTTPVYCSSVTAHLSYMLLLITGIAPEEVLATEEEADQ